MHYLSTLIKALALTIALAAPTQAFANLATTPATPSVEAPVEAPVVVCGAGPTWEEGKDAFITTMESAGASFIGQSKVFDDGSFAVLFDLRTYTGDPKPDPAAPIFVMAFDVNGCYIASFFVSEVEAKDRYGIVLANG